MYADYKALYTVSRKESNFGTMTGALLEESEKLDLVANIDKTKGMLLSRWNLIYQHLVVDDLNVERV